MEMPKWFTGVLRAIWNTEISCHSIQIKHGNAFFTEDSEIVTKCKAWTFMQAG